jgi:hypothetical protein
MDMRRNQIREANRMARRDAGQSVDLQIDELVLYGFAHGDRYRIARAIETELTRLIAEKGIPPAFMQNADRPSLHAGPIDIESGTRPDVVGSRVARAVYGRMRR